MMIRYRHIILLALCSIILALFPACLKEYPYLKSNAEEKNITLSLSWNNLFPGTGRPDSICFYFYPLNGNPPFKYICGGENTRQSIPLGEYQVLIFNFDVKRMQFRHMERYETAEAFISPSSKSGDTAASDADMLYGTSIDYFSVSRNSSDQQTIIPEKLVQQLSFSIQIEKLENVAACSGSLSGMSASMSLSKKVPVATEHISVPFQTSRTATGVEASLFVFGICPKTENEPPVSNLVRIDLTFTDGSTSSAQADLTPLLQTTSHNDAPIVMDSEKDFAGNITLKATLTPWIDGGNAGTDIQ